MTIAQRFIAGKKKDNTTVPSGRLNPTPKHTVFIRPHGTSVVIHVIPTLSRDLLSNIPIGIFLKLPLFLS